jgi:hypothetical protein
MLFFYESQLKAIDVHNLEKNIVILENKVKYYKSAHGLISIFVEHALEENDSNAQVKRYFYAKYF